MATPTRQSKRWSKNTPPFGTTTVALFFCLAFVVSLFDDGSSSSKLGNRRGDGHYYVRAYSTGAGSCDYDGVLHGLPSSKPSIARSGDIEFTLGTPGVNVPGAVALLQISSARRYKGFMIYAVDSNTERPIGKWLKKDMPERAQIHPMCEYAVTHDLSHSKNGGQFKDVVPWVVPAKVPANVTFRVTVVEEYETWYAFEMEYKRGSARGGGVNGLKLIKEDIREVDRNGNKAPSLGAAMSGGYTPTVTNDEGDEEKEDTREAFRKQSAKDPDGMQYKAKLAQKKDFHKSLHNKLVKGGENRDIYIPDPKRRAKKASERVSEETKMMQRRTIGRLAHGVCMFILWVVCAPASASIARYGKGNATGWFTVHKSLSTIILYGTLFGIFGILYLRGFSTPWGPHGTYGLKTLGLCVVQMTLGNIRNWIPRPIFRFIHRWLGVAAVLLSWYTCLLGARLLSNIEKMPKVSTLTYGSMFLVLAFVWLMQRNHSKFKIDTKARFSV